MIWESKTLFSEGGEIGVEGQVENDLFVVRNPVEAPPDLAPENLLRTLRRFESAGGFEHGEEDPDVGGVLVHAVVRVEDLRTGRPQQPLEIIDQGVPQSGILRDSTGMAELGDEGVLPEPGGLPLLFGADADHPGVAKIRIRPRSGASGTVRAGDASEPGVGPLKTGKDAVRRHKLEVVGMGADAETGRAGERVRHGARVGDVNLRLRVREGGLAVHGGNTTTGDDKYLP